MSLEPDDDDLSVVAGYLARSGVNGGLPLPPGTGTPHNPEPTCLVLIGEKAPSDSPTGLSQAASSELDDDDLLSGLL